MPRDHTVSTSTRGSSPQINLTQASPTGPANQNPIPTGPRRGPTQVPWNNSGQTNLLKQALSQATLNSLQVPSGNGGQASQKPTPASGAAKVYDPSQGPTGSTATTAPKAPVPPATQLTNNTHPGPAITQICRRSRYTKYDFELGDIIALPYHTPNNNPNLLPTDRRLAMTCEGPVYSKRRMAIVLWVYQHDLFCIPLYTHSHNGLRNKGPNHIMEFVCIKNLGARDFFNQGHHPPLVADCKYPLDKDTSAHVAGAFRVACNDDITWAGRLTEDSYFDLRDTWKWVSERAKQQPWVR
jgi:hypothetical protein